MVVNHKSIDCYFLIVTVYLIAANFLSEQLLYGCNSYIV
jgi:hypothetical protein